MSWQLAILALLALVLIGGGLWFERSRPSARIIAAVAALAALGVAGRVALAPLPNVVATTDIVLLAGYTLGGAPGFAVGALSALVSNFWLGQGPWTPWQMAGWGMVGIGGAALALLTGRRLGRWGLAAAAALAGLLYGALLDLSVMVNFGGEQSLDRYLALSARGIPFNILHAIGNAAIMLAAGPALVRMLGRYRERFEIRWPAPDRPPARLPTGAACVLLAVVVAAPALAPERADAGAGEGRSWLRDAQNGDGGFGTEPGGSSNPGMTGWAILGLEAAGRNPLDVRKGGRTPIDYLRRNSDELSSTGDLERTILALRGAGRSASDFAGRDLLAELRSRESSKGSYEKQVNLTAFAILARAAAGESGGDLSRPAKWLREAQNRDGGWGSTANAASEPDSTGAAIQALVAAGSGSGDVSRGVDWLRKAQHRDGGWSLTEGGTSNSQSTAWALQGLIAAGASARGVRNGGNTGISYLRKRQRSDGHYAYSSASDQTPVWVTAQVLMALEGEAFPLAAVPRDPDRGGGGGGSGSGSGGSAGPGAGAGGAGKRAAQKAGRSGGAAAGGSGRRGRDGGDGGAATTALDPLAAVGEQGPLIPGGGDSEMPSTPILLGILAAIAAALGGGWFLYRRRLP